MRRIGAGLALALALSALQAAPALADPVSGRVVRGADNFVRVELRNDGSGRDQFLRLEFPAGTQIVSTQFVSGAVGNCMKGDDRSVLCDFAPSEFWPAGATIVIEVRTAAPLADNAGANAFVCSSPCGGAFSGPFAIPGPSTGGADLEIVVDSVKSEAAHYQVGRRLAIIHFGVDVGNRGPAAASNVSVDLIATNSPPGTESFNPRPNQNCNLVGSLEPQPLLCTLAGLAPSPRREIGQYGLRFSSPGRLRVTAKVSAATSDPDALNNTDLFTGGVSVPRSTGRVSGDGLFIDGRSRNAVAIQVAVAREEAGRLGAPRRPVGFGLLTGAPESGQSAVGCRWLTSTRVRFRRERGRRCDQPSYIRARVRRGRWRIRLRRKLPRGRYVMMTRGVSRAGAIESGISRRLGNLKRFRVR